MAEIKGDEFSPYVILKGTVRDDFGDYAPGVKLLYTSNVKNPDGSIAKQPVTDFGSTVNDTFTETSSDPITTPVQYNATGITDASGDFYMYIPAESFVTGSIELYFKPPKGTTLGDKQINKINTEDASGGNVQETVSLEEVRETMPEATEEVKASEYIIYDLGDIQLSGFTYLFEELQRSIRDKITIVETKIIDLANKFKLPTEEQLIKLFHERKELLKENLLPILLTLFNAFGPNIVQAIQSGASNAILSKLKTCPTKDEIEVLLVKRNSLVKQLNIIYKFVKILQTIGISTTIIVQALKIGLASYVAAPPPYISAMDTVKSRLEKRLELYGIIASGLTTIASIIGYILGLILDFLSKLDSLIKECSEEQDIPFEALNQELNKLADPTLIKQIQNNEVIYKGFTLKVELTPITVGIYQSRVGVAYNRSGTPVLKTPTSFTSNPELLLQQLQLVIDTQDLKAD